MNNPSWLIEKYIFDENLDTFKSVFNKYNVKYKVFEYFPFMDINCSSLFKDDETVIFYGSLNLARELRKHAKWIPGVWGNLHNLKCTTYYNHLGQFLLNDNYIMLPYGELLRNKEFLFKTIGVNGCLFVRPDSGFKAFTGGVIYESSYEADVKQLGFYDVDCSNIVIVSSPKNIYEEYRMICIDKQIVTGCMYKLNRKEHYSKDVPSEVFEYASKIANTWQPDNCFTVDVCRTDDGYKLVEINSFSSSGFYSCDIEQIVVNANKMALKEVEDYRNETLL